MSSACPVLDWPIDHCGRPVPTRGKACSSCRRRPRIPLGKQTWCQLCFNANQRRRRREGPLELPRIPDPLRTANGCLIWQGTPNKDGYGVVKIIGRGSVLVHRQAFEDAKGPILAGHTVDHLCETLLCVEPAHLEQCTFGENTRRWWARRRGQLAVLGQAA